MSLRRAALAVLTVAAVTATAACASAGEYAAKQAALPSATTKAPGPSFAAAATDAATGDTGTATPTPVGPTSAVTTSTSVTVMGFPGHADAYVSILIDAWQKNDRSGMTVYAGPNVAAFLAGLKAPSSIGAFTDHVSGGRTTVMVTGDPGGADVPLSFVVQDSLLSGANAVVSVTDGRTVTG